MKEVRKGYKSFRNEDALSLPQQPNVFHFWNPGKKRSEGMKSRVGTTLSAVSICSRLEGLIRSGVKAGLIEAALSQAIYIHAGNFLITIASQDVGNLPYGILLPRGTMQLLGEFKPGDNVEFSPERIWFPRLAITIGFSNADFWVPHPFIRNRIGSLDAFVTNLCVLRKELLAISNADQGLVRIAQLTEPITGIVDGAYILNLLL